MTIDLPTLSVVVTSGLIDSINPCAIGVLILMLSVALAEKAHIHRLIVLTSIYILGVFIAYLLSGLGLVYVLSSIPLAVTEYLSLTVATVIIVAGLIEIKDFFWYGQGFSLQIPGMFRQSIHRYLHRLSYISVFFVGAFVAAVELPCTGAPYLAVITVLAQNFNAQAFLMLVIFNLVFILPLVVVLLFVVFGMKLARIENWKQSHRHYMRLIIGQFLIALGWLLMLIANSSLNFG